MINLSPQTRARQHMEAAERLILGAMAHPEAASGLLKCAELHTRKARRFWNERGGAA